MLALALIAASVADLPNGELLVVSAEWCSPCKQQAPIIQRFEREGIVVYHVDYDKQRNIAEAWRITAVPTVLVLHGNKEFARFVGLTSYEKIKSMVGNPVHLIEPKPAQSKPSQLINWWMNAGPTELDLLKQAAPQQQPQQQKTSNQYDVPALAVACDVRIKVQSPNLIAWGSGTIINYGQKGTEIVTNKHVLGNEGTITIDDGTDYWKGVRCSEVWPGRQYSSGADDIAIILADKLPPASTAVCDIGYAPIEPIYMIGNPHGGTPTLYQTRILKRWRNWDGANNITLDKHTVSGDSGGGVYDSTGTLVGVIWGDDPEGDGGLAVDLTRSQAIQQGTRTKSQRGIL